MLVCIQVEPTAEERTEAQIRAIVPQEVCPACFHLTRRMHRRFHGRWRDVTERFLPSYIFLETIDLERCYQELKRVPMLTKMLGLSAWGKEDVGSFIQLTPEEEDMIRRLAMGGGAAAPGLVDISRIEVLEGDRVEILDGPLRGFEGQIRKLDLHRRRAVVSLAMFGRALELYFGVEIVRKR